MRKICINITLLSIIAIVLLLNLTNYAEALGEKNLKIIVDGENITELASPIIENDRTLVALRFVSEAIGAEVSWDEVNRTVSVVQKDNDVLFWIGSQLVAHDHGTVYDLSDVAPKIINDRTYVPLRLISNVLGIGIDWDESTRTVSVDSEKNSTIEPFFDVKITSHTSADTISEKTTIQVSIPDRYKNETNEIKLLLLDKNTAKGFVVASEKQLDGAIAYLPKVEDQGKKVLVAAIYDENRNFIGGDSILVNIDVKPQVILTGVKDFEVIKDRITMSQTLNFLAFYVDYELTNLGNGKTTIINERDPQGSYSWTPTMEQNGSYLIKAIAYDGNGIGYESKALNATFATERKLSLVGVSEGMTVNKPVTLLASRNFDVTETQFIIRDADTGIESVLATIPYGGHTWFPGTEYAGNHQVLVRVKDTAGVSYDSNPINVKVDGNPKVFIQGIGPKQVLTGEAKLSVNSNVPLDYVNYVLTNKTTGAKKTIGSNLNFAETFSYIPSKEDAGDFLIQAEGIYQGDKLSSESISFKIYMGTLYGAKPLIEKDQFIDFASSLANDSWDKTGMSAALQTAQAILETGWGQSVPVDKYNGVFSNNLFGIKGTGNKGSVISNTWEVYNGVSYRIDAKFRAYSSVLEGWEDHKRILLNLSRYEPFRDVMYDSTLAAWAIRRAGYATDPQYPLKLMRIIKQYNLQKLDEVGIGL